MIIREITNEDIMSVTKLAQKTHSETFGDSMSNEKLSKELEARSEEYFRSVMNKDVILVAKNDDKLVGFIQFGPVSYDSFPTSKKDIELKKIYIDKNHQGKGLGKNLINEMLAHSRLKDVESVYLDVFEKNEKAIGLYKKFGFQVIGKTPFKIDGRIIGYDLLMKRVLSEGIKLEAK